MTLPLPRAAAPRVALVKLSSLGDVVHALPTAHALRRWWPRAELTWVVERREQAILLGNPDLDHVVTVDTRLWRRELRHPSRVGPVLETLRGLRRRLREGRFDVALDLQGLWKSGLVTWLTGAPLRLGFERRFCRERGSAWFTTHRVELPDETTHVVDRHLLVAGALGVDSEVCRERVFPIASDAAAEARMASRLAQVGIGPGSSPVVLLPGSGGGAKRWPLTSFRALGDALASRLGGAIVVMWGPGEEPMARAVADGITGKALAAPPSTIVELVAVLRRATVVVGGDTGPMHIAAALGVPTVGLYGPTSASRNRPCGPRASAVASPTGRMTDIAVADVVTAVEGLLR